MATNEKNMKTWNQCCEEVANKRGFSFAQNLFVLANPKDIEQATKEAAELYREEGIKEAVKLARERVAKDHNSFANFVGSQLEKYTESEILEKLKL